MGSVRDMSEPPKKIPYGRQSISQDDIDAVVSVLQSDWLTQGPRSRAFEEALCAQTGAKHCVVVANGTVALQLACLALDVGPGDVGLTSPISFMASANCVAYCGGIPDFTDIDPLTLCLSPEKVRKYCENGTIPKVVIPVDFAGVPAQLPRFKELSDTFGFKLIEDAAHAIGSSYQVHEKEYACGGCAHTDLAIFSFHPVKTITSGEGGAVLTNDDGLAHRLRLFSNHGIERDPSRFTNSGVSSDQPTAAISPPGWYHEMQLLGQNGRITDIQCALGLSQLRRLGAFKANRKNIVQKYNNVFAPLAESKMIILPPWPEGTDPCYHLYPVRLGPNCSITRDELFLRLQDRGIYCQIHYIPIYRQPFYKEQYGYTAEDFPHAENYFTHCISLPLYSELDEETFSYVAETFVSIILNR